MPRSRKASFMLWIWPTIWIELPGVSCVLQLGDDLVDLVGDAAEIAALNAGIDLVDRLDVGLVGVGRHAAALERRDVAEQARHRVAAAAIPRRRDRRVAEVVQAR